jgi:hypothetical protein
MLYYYYYDMRNFVWIRVPSSINMGMEGGDDFMEADVIMQQDDESIRTEND